MAETKLVKDQAKEGEMLIQKLLENHFDVTSAFWLLHSEKEDWRLFIVTKSLNGKKGSEAYHELQSAFEQVPDLWMDVSDVKLVDPSDRVAQEIAAIQARSPIKLKDRHHIKLGGMTSADVHIYPLPAQPATVPGN